MSSSSSSSIVSESSKDFRANILDQLRSRNRRETKPFADLIAQHSKSFEKAVSLQQENTHLLFVNEKLRQEGGAAGGAGGAGPAASSVASAELSAKVRNEFHKAIHIFISIFSRLGSGFARRIDGASSAKGRKRPKSDWPDCTSQNWRKTFARQRCRAQECRGQNSASSKRIGEYEASHGRVGKHKPAAQGKMPNMLKICRSFQFPYFITF